MGKELEKGLEKLWAENNRLNGSNLFYIKILAKQKKLTLQETIHHGYDALFFTSGLETYKVIVNTDECKLNLLGKNKVGNAKNKYRHIKDFEGVDAWFEAVQFISGLSRSKRSGEYLCIGKRFCKRHPGSG